MFCGFCSSKSGMHSWPVLVRRVSWVDCYTLMQISRMTFSLQTFRRLYRMQYCRKDQSGSAPIASTYPFAPVAFHSTRWSVRTPPFGMHRESDKSVICQVGRRKSHFFRTPKPTNYKGQERRRREAGGFRTGSKPHRLCARGGGAGKSLCGKHRTALTSARSSSAKPPSDSP
jgi:hypothetical protein